MRSLVQAPRVFTVLDFETTGLNCLSDSIIEMGAVRVVEGKVMGAFRSLIDPGIPIPYEASTVNGITDDMVRGQPLLEHMLPVFMEFIDGSFALIAHNAEFDIGFLSAALQKHGLAPWRGGVIDSKAVAKQTFPNQESYSLQRLAQSLHLKRGIAHRALDDALLCMRLFLLCTTVQTSVL